MMEKLFTRSHGAIRCHLRTFCATPLAALRTGARARLPRHRAPAGFTLVELLVVLVILGLIMAFAAPRVIQYLGGAKTDAAKIQIERLSNVLDLYRLEVGRYPDEQMGLDALIERPPDVETWNGPYLRNADSLTDPWGRPYIYRYPGEHGEFDLYSLGADGREGGEGENQDLTSW
ncbi:MAG TPA: type II secretion system major pseudopilin GspG [Kiloniellales bacterium]|nr:type II secretion system major pseudopilin GspG [Kiloniellales bacterium]